MYWSLEKGEKEVSAMDDPLNLFSLAKEAMVMPVDAIIYLLFASSQVWSCCFELLSEGKVVPLWCKDETVSVAAPWQGFNVRLRWLRGWLTCRRALEEPQRRLGRCGRNDQTELLHGIWPSMPGSWDNKASNAAALIWKTGWRRCSPLAVTLVVWRIFWFWARSGLWRICMYIGCSILFPFQFY